MTNDGTKRTDDVAGPATHPQGRPEDEPGDTADEEALNEIVNFIRSWKPTQIFTPAAEDTHPDHSAFFVLLQLALEAPPLWDPPQ